MSQEVIVTAVRQPDSRLVTTRERALEEARRKKTKPFNWEEYTRQHATPGFASKEELEAFLEDIYSYRRAYRQ